VGGRSKVGRSGTCGTFEAATIIPSAAAGRSAALGGAAWVAEAEGILRWSFWRSMTQGRREVCAPAAVSCGVRAARTEVFMEDADKRFSGEES